MIKKHLKSAILITTLLLITIINCAKESGSDSSRAGKNMIGTIESADGLKKIMESSGSRLLVIDLYADWCIPCRLLMPVLSEMAAELKGRADFYQINVDKNPEIAKIFNVTGIPLVILIKNGTAVHAVQGLMPGSEYMRAINSYLDGASGRSDSEPDGEIINGIRTIRLSPEAAPGDIYVYRGEEVKIVIDEAVYPYSIHIPEYKISREGVSGKKLEVIFKAEKTGVFPVFCNGKCPSGDGSQFGRIIVMQFKTDGRTEYAEIDAAGAKKLIEEKKPLILDVRTPNEFYEGHITGAKLIPLQQLEERVSEISGYKDRDILVYCRSGNRSTVASEILRKHGFKKIYNLRSGIKGWLNEGYEISQ